MIIFLIMHSKGNLANTIYGKYDVSKKWRKEKQVIIYGKISFFIPFFTTQRPNYYSWFMESKKSLLGCLTTLFLLLNHMDEYITSFSTFSQYRILYAAKFMEVIIANNHFHNIDFRHIWLESDFELLSKIIFCFSNYFFIF